MTFKMEHKIPFCFHSLTVYKTNMNVGFSQILGPCFSLHMNSTFFSVEGVRTQTSCPGDKASPSLDAAGGPGGVR